MYPYLAIQAVSMVVLYYWPWLALWLPEAIYGASTR
jgi:hypothetical protein